jgi:hypothetical protein
MWEGVVMTTQPAELHTTYLLRYVIASADMYYAEMEQRDVFLSCDEHGNFRFWGEIKNGGPSTTIDLFEIFLEYGLYCCSWSGTEEAFYNMQNFGERLGKCLAKHLKDTIPSYMSENAAIAALKRIFETMDVSPSVEKYIGGEVCFTITDFPLEKAARRSGLQTVELARHGINALCQSMMQGITPHLVMSASSDARSEFIFKILVPNFA